MSKLNNGDFLSKATDLRTELDERYITKEYCDNKKQRYISKELCEAKESAIKDDVIEIKDQITKMKENHLVHMQSSLNEMQKDLSEMKVKLALITSGIAIAINILFQYIFR